jgi:MFS family permease
VVNGEQAERGWLSVFGGLCLVLLLTFTAFGAAVPILPQLIEGPLHAPSFAVGSAFALSAVAALLSRPYLGRLAQQAGSRRVMLAGAVLAALVGGAYALDATGGHGAGLGGLLATRVLMGIAEAAVFTAGSLWAVALAPVSRRGQLVGIYGLAMWGGWTLGPVVGQLLLENVGYGGVWIAHAVLPALAAVVLTCLPARAAGRNAGQAASRKLLPPPVILPGTALALAAVGYSALSGFVVLHLAARGVGGGPLALSLFGAAYIVVRLVAGRLPDRAGAGRVAVACGLTEAVGLLLLAVAGSAWMAGLGAVVMGAGFTLLYPSLALLVINRSAESERGAALGAYTSFWDLGLGAAGLVTGAIASVSLPDVFVVGAVAAVAAAGTGHLAGRRRGGQRQAPALPATSRHT